jgi:hypothetical protein
MHIHYYKFYDGWKKSGSSVRLDWTVEKYKVPKKQVLESTKTRWTNTDKFLGNFQILFKNKE